MRRFISTRVGRTVVISLTIAASSLATAVYAVAGHEASKPSITGCLTSGGSLVKLAVGDAPKTPCQATTQIEVHLGPGDITQVIAGEGLTGGGESGAVTLAVEGTALGCPDGSTLFIGVCIEDDAREAANHPDATDDCADEGKRLPSGGELQAFAEKPGVTLSGGEWTDDLGDVNRAPTFSYFVVADPGNGVAEAFDDYAYRCVGGPTLG